MLFCYCVMYWEKCSRNWAALTLSVPNFRRHLSSAFYFNKPSLGKTFICIVERLNVKQLRSRWDGSLCRLIWIYAVCKRLLLSPVAVKELSRSMSSEHARRAKVQFRLHRREVWSRHSMSTAKIIEHYRWYQWEANPGWDTANAQGNVNPNILRMLECTFSLDTPSCSDDDEKNQNILTFSCILVWKDPQGTKINQWDASNSEMIGYGGVYPAKQLMSEYPELGTWKLVATLRVSFIPFTYCALCTV